VAEEEFARGLHALRSGAERHLVHVHLKDFVLGILPVELDRPPELDELAPDRYVGTVGMKPARQLLRDGAGSGEVLPRDDVESRADDALEPEAVMGVEMLVLPRDQGVYEVRRDVRDGDYLPLLLAEELGDLPVIDVRVGSAGLCSPN
jgi:hypothetical protein